MKTMLKALLISHTVLLALPLATVVKAETTSEIYKSSKESIVLIISYDKYGMPLGLGSGFFAKKNQIATNYHVVEGAERILFKVIGADTSHTINSISRYSKTLDIAILETEYDGAPLELGVSEDISVGEKVVAIGNPRGLEGSVSEGIISAKRNMEEFYLLQITTPISPGSSGGLLFDVDGQVIGITTATIQDAQNLDFAVPIALLKKLEVQKTAWEPKIGKGTLPLGRGTAGLELILPEIVNPSGCTLAYSLKNTTKNAIENLMYLLIFRSRSTDDIIHF